MDSLSNIPVAPPRPTPPLGRASVCDLRQVPEISQDLGSTCPFLLGIRALAGIKKRKEMTLFYREIVKVESCQQFQFGYSHILKAHDLLYTPWRETLES